MQKLYFVRHGLSVLNEEGKYAGLSDTPLTDKGRAQARLAGQEAKKLKLDYIISSPLSRALETAQIIAHEIGYPSSDIHINSLLTERNFGTLEGKTWSPDRNLDEFPDIETVDSILERAKLTLDLLKTVDAKHVLIVSHGAFGRALRHHLIPDKPYHYNERFENARITEFI